MMRLAYAIAVGLALAGITHVASLLGVPYFAPLGAYDRLAGLDAEGRFVVLPEDGAGGDMLPFRDPAFATAVCRYDLAGGPVTVRANLPSSYGAVAVYNRTGQPFYALTDRAATNGMIEVTILGASDVAAAEQEEPDEPRPSVRIVSPTPTGFVLVRLFVGAPSARKGLADLATKATCGRAADTAKPAASAAPPSQQPPQPVPR